MKVSNDVIMDHVRSHEHTQDDFRVCTHYGIIKRDEKVVCPVDETGCFTSKVTNFKGKYVEVIITVLIQHCVNCVNVTMCYFNCVNHTYTS